MNRRISYRFKTEAEFIEEFGYDWKNEVSFNDECEMDYLIGTDIVIPEDCLDYDGDIIKKFTIPNINTSYHLQYF
jgi:hypothetical protein